MDPSGNLCLVRNSFDNLSVNPEKDKEVKLHTFSEQLIGSPRSRKMKASDSFNSQIQNSKNLKNISLPYISRKPVEIKSEVFSDIAIVLANVDAVYNYSKSNTSYISPQDTKEFSYSVLFQNSSSYDKPNLESWKYVEYLQYRLPIAKGFILDSYFEKYPDHINMNNLDFSSDILYPLRMVPTGMDLVIYVNSSKENKEQKEGSWFWKNALKILSLGGTLLYRIRDNDMNIRELYNLAICFDKFSLLKPLSDDQNYSFIIAEDYRGPWDSTMSFDSQSSLSPSLQFTTFMMKYVDLVLHSSSFSKNVPIYDEYKCKALWNIF